MLGQDLRFQAAGVRVGRVAVQSVPQRAGDAEMLLRPPAMQWQPVSKWSVGDGSKLMLLAKSVRHVGQGTECHIHHKGTNMQTLNFIY